MSKRKSGIILFFIVLFTTALTLLNFLSFPLPKFIANGTKDYNSIGSLIKLGIDLKGGYYTVLTPKPAEGEEQDVTDDLFDSAVDILRARLDNNGYTEATITVQGIGQNREIRVEIPEVDEPDKIMKIVASAGVLTFEDSSGTIYLTGSDIKKSQAGYDNDGNPLVLLEFTSEGTAKFANATQKLTGSNLNIKLDGETISSPMVNEQISSTTAQITGIESYAQAESIAAVINAGKLPLDFEVQESNRISATLGEYALLGSIIAGAIGMLIIFIILIIKYRGLGIAASLALTIYANIMIVLLAIIPWVQLTLPGIAGIILSIGMAVDANVIIFERIKDEYKSGKTVISAIKSGFKRAVITIIDSNITTILCAIVLWILCPGSIKGFAITLFLGIILSMITSILITRGLIKLINVFPNNKAKFNNLKREAINDEEN